ncbi:MAG: YbfB/YjiJ family MFS transporter [Planctomycetota bacterium]
MAGFWYPADAVELIIGRWMPSEAQTDNGEYRMTIEYSVDTCRHLSERFREEGIERPMRVSRYDPGDRLTYQMTGVAPSNRARVTVEVDRFVGGGFAGQVYRVKIIEIEPISGELAGVEVGQLCAMKILIPPSKGAKTFRDAVYFAGFQAPFSLQVLPAASRAGALWQKFIRRAAGLRFGSERAVVDIYATFVDERIGSCGEISEWVEGRTWRFEVDDNLLARKKWRPGEPDDGLGSPEYRGKKAFMAGFVDLLHEMGAHEFARQYEWWTCKSQPNALKRRDREEDPKAGLTAVDFRAGLALLPFLPMAPGDVPLIAKGVRRGSLVQFDRGDLRKLRAFVEAHPDEFADLAPALEELEACERQYRNAMPDVTHNHHRLLHDCSLWRGIWQGAVTGWRVQNKLDDARAAQLGKSWPGALLFGFTFMGIVALMLTLVGRLYPENPARPMARLTLWYGIAQVTGPAIGGWMAETAGRYTGATLLAVAVLALGLVPLTLLLRRSERLPEPVLE